MSLREGLQGAGLLPSGIPLNKSKVCTCFPGAPLWPGAPQLPPWAVVLPAQRRAGLGAGLPSPAMGRGRSDSAGGDRGAGSQARSLPQLRASWRERAEALANRCLAAASTHLNPGARSPFLSLSRDAEVGLPCRELATEQGGKVVQLRWPQPRPAPPTLFLPGRGVPHGLPHSPSAGGRGLGITTGHKCCTHGPDAQALAMHLPLVSDHLRSNQLRPRPWGR